jgi:hypothetical protein
VAAKDVRSLAVLDVELVLDAAPDPAAADAVRVAACRISAVGAAAAATSIVIKCRQA